MNDKINISANHFSSLRTTLFLAAHLHFPSSWGKLCLFNAGTCKIHLSKSITQKLSHQFSASSINLLLLLLHILSQAKPSQDTSWQCLHTDLTTITAHNECANAEEGRHPTPSEIFSRIDQVLHVLAAVVVAVPKRP